MPRRGASKRLTATQKRKKEHLEICLDERAVTGPLGTGLDRYRFVHNALPELNLDEIDVSVTFLGRRLRAPLLISSMTGGFDVARKINRNLAAAAQHLGIAMGVGSQRVALEEPGVAASFQVRDIAPDIFLLGNLGAVQLNYGYTVDHCRRAVEMIGADALILHLNVLQEAAQPEGNRNFKGLTAKIAEVCRQAEFPVLAKEIGSGIAGAVAVRLRDAGVSAIDVAGRGGTSWYTVEARRASGGEAPKSTFSGWGIPTEEAIVAVRRAVPELALVASGGIRSGLDVAKSLALGADLAGLGQPLLAAALESPGRVIELLAGMIRDLKIAMLCAGAVDVGALKTTPLVREA
jgi:isopentenyl-diphosphate delta-isomerase